MGQLRCGRGVGQVRLGLNPNTKAGGGRINFFKSTLICVGNADIVSTFRMQTGPDSREYPSLQLSLVVSHPPRSAFRGNSSSIKSKPPFLPFPPFSNPPFPSRVCFAAAAAMANHLYGYGSSYGGPGLTSSYSSRLGGAEAYIPESSFVGSARYMGSDPLSAMDSTKYSVLEGSSASPYLNQSDALKLSASQIAGVEGYSSSKLSGAMYSQLGASMNLSLIPGAKRPSEALYHQTLLGTHNTIGQSEALFSTNSLVKRTKLEIGSHLPIYPQRPGEKDCAHYMLTRACKFGENCKFDHPLWVPEGGIPDWKEVPVINTPESLPERPGEPDCPYFMKTQRCKFGVRCKFNHPKDKLSEVADISTLPERPSQPICSYYAKTGKCKFGANCIFHHPKDLQIPSSGQDPGSGEQAEIAVIDETESSDSIAMKPAPFTPALLHNSKGLPIRPGEQDCPFYLKTGSCKYGAACRYNHPDRNALGHAIISPPAANLPIGIMNPATSLLASMHPHISQPTFYNMLQDLAKSVLSSTAGNEVNLFPFVGLMMQLGVGPTIYPQRPGQMECDANKGAWGATLRRQGIL
ncbi:hypothetical protein Taro_008002 [Colocasia esculenta]|uniref:C3H1-type domain-containing protein n=1 Tax=Colocasia esculenta TaxID=4460 RepID=A0A843U171_COLES|nr:hypothetical protein [Colocasia esculenta]